MGSTFELVSTRVLVPRFKLILAPMKAAVAPIYNTIPVLSNLGPAYISQIHQKCNIAYDTKNLWDHFKLLNRLIYRSNNQHKASFAFKHLKEVQGTKISINYNYLD